MAAIIPAYNERKTVGPIVRALKTCPSVDEVVVVSDGSTDGTADEARSAGADVVYQLPIKHGKGQAMAHGVARTDAEIIFFCDADLLNFKAENAAAIIRPVAEGKWFMSVGMRDRGRFLTWLEGKLPLISGERAMRRFVFESIPDQYLQGFKVEAALNYFCRANRLPYGSIPSWGERIVGKMKKVGFWKGLVEYIAMFWQVGRSMLEVRLARRTFRERGAHWKHHHSR